MIKQGEIISYLDMCKAEGVNLQRGMNFRLRGGVSVILMSRSSNAPYADRIENEGRILIYEGHDEPKTLGLDNPKGVDQPYYSKNRNLTQNGLFCEAVKKFKSGRTEPELIKVYEKIKSGIWAFNGVFRLIGCWQEESMKRKVFKFKLEITNSDLFADNIESLSINQNRMIPSAVKLEVWKRDKGKCVRCGSQDNLHFDHIIPYSKGGSSLTAENIQLLCVRHNLEKRDKII